MISIVNPAEPAENVAIPSKPGQRLQYVEQAASSRLAFPVAIPSKPGQRLQSHVHPKGGDFELNVAIPSKPGQRLQWGRRFANRPPGHHVAIPSKPGQRLQSRERGGQHDAPQLSQSLPNQVNDFNPQSETVWRQADKCRNPFQTRSTTSIPWRQDLAIRAARLSQSLPNQVNDFNKRRCRPPQGSIRLSQSLPNQVNDFNALKQAKDVVKNICRNPFQTRSTTSIWRP